MQRHTVKSKSQEILETRVTVCLGRLSVQLKCHSKVLSDTYKAKNVYPWLSGPQDLLQQPEGCRYCSAEKIIWCLARRTWNYRYHWTWNMLLMKQLWKCCRWQISSQNRRNRHAATATNYKKPMLSNSADVYVLFAKQ